MKLITRYLFIIAAISLFWSCSVIEKSSKHEFYSGFYRMETGDKKSEKVYLDILDEKVNVYPVKGNKVDRKSYLSFQTTGSDSSYLVPLTFSRKSLDIDITTIIFKYRPGMKNLPAQLNTDYNAAIYAGWCNDNYKIGSEIDLLGKYHKQSSNWGYNFGVFVGPGTTLISPFTTQNTFSGEYNGMIVQFGVAGFIESNIASFGIATGYDYLLSPHRNVWIYNKKPWVGLIVGIALN